MSRSFWHKMHGPIVAPPRLRRPEPQHRRDTPPRPPGQAPPPAPEQPAPAPEPARPAPVRQAAPPVLRDGPNAYVCRSPQCGATTMVRHLEPCTVPDVLVCRANPECGAWTLSRFYPFSRATPIPRALAELPVWEWYRPEPGDPALNLPGMGDYLRGGGLALRGPLDPDWPPELVEA